MAAGWRLSVAAAALAAVATLSRQALVLNSVEAARPRCTCYGPGSILGAGRVLDNPQHGVTLLFGSAGQRLDLLEMCQ